MLSRITKLVLEVVALSTIVATASIAVLSWRVLPETVPIHFNLVGQPDGFGPKYTLLLIPALMLVMYTAFSALARFPQLSKRADRTEVQNARYFQLTRSLMSWMKAELGVLFLYIQWSIVATASGAAIGLNPFVLVGIIAILWTTMATVYIRWLRNSDSKK